MVPINSACFSFWLGVSTSLAMVMTIAAIVKTIASIAMSSMVSIHSAGFGFRLGICISFWVWFSTPLAMVMISNMAIPSITVSPMVSYITSTGFSFSISFSPRGYKK
ncbi:unnamed protein product [Meganyctiphanes norvegica]|uniref:Uncharacterized protein n=1 Tax=Meganyctiphanes norvegica TaxID=48144 RepID=A0AAV2R5W2_MEGNR